MNLQRDSQQRSNNIENKDDSKTKENNSKNREFIRKKKPFNARKQMIKDAKQLYKQRKEITKLQDTDELIDYDEYYDVPIQIPWGKIGFVLLLLIAMLVFVAYKTVVKDFERKTWITDPKTIQVSVEKGAQLSEISAQLKDAGLVKFDSLFSLYTQYVSGKSSQIQYGDFEFTTDMSYDDLISILCVQQVFTKTIQVTFPEGSTAVAIAQLMEQNGLCTVDEFLVCANGEDGSDWSQYEFWNLIPDNKRLMKCEGYLFPDTYEFYVGDDVYNYVDKFYKEFDSKVDGLMMDIDDSSYSLDDIVILASFIQEEAGKKEEDAKVSAVFHNRLESTDPLWASHILQSNTCSYIMQDNENNYLWNSPTAEYLGYREKGEIPAEVLEVYDTYKVSGLPAGPVSNPGYDAIYAALYPDQTYINEGYYFFVTGHPDTDVAGQYFYAKTAEEHQKNVEMAGWA